jgi:hypothetical protein
MKIGTYFKRKVTDISELSCVLDISTEVLRDWRQYPLLPTTAKYWAEIGRESRPILYAFLFLCKEVSHV